MPEAKPALRVPPLGDEKTSHTHSESHPARGMVNENQDRVFWHGGAPGIQVGKRVRPAAGLPMPNTYRLPGYIADRTKVYVTTDRKLATHYAASWAGLNGSFQTGGTLYRVEPSGPLEVDPDYDQVPGLSYACRLAVVVEIAENEVFPTVEIELYGRSFNTWWDGSKMYDSKGYLRATPEMLEAGITHKELRQFGPQPDLEEAAQWATRNFDIKRR